MVQKRTISYYQSKPRKRPFGAIMVALAKNITYWMLVAYAKNKTVQYDTKVDYILLGSMPDRYILNMKGMFDLQDKMMR